MDLIAIKPGQINSKLSVFNSLYSANMAILFLLVVIEYPEINLPVIGFYICINAVARLLYLYIRPDRVENHLAHIDKHKFGEEMVMVGAPAISSNRLDRYTIEQQAPRLGQCETQSE